MHLTGSGKKQLWVLGSITQKLIASNAHMQINTTPHSILSSTVLVFLQIAVTTEEAKIRAQIANKSEKYNLENLINFNAAKLS